MSRRRLSAPGLSYVDANRGRVVTYMDDVQGVKQQIQERWPTLEVMFDLEDEEWLVIEHCHDGTDRLVFATKYLDHQAICRLEKADGHAPGAEDYLEAIDKHNAGIERDHDRAMEEISGELGERLIHAFKKDGLYDHLDIYGTRPRIPNRVRDRAVRSTPDAA